MKSIMKPVLLSALILGSPLAVAAGGTYATPKNSDEKPSLTASHSGARVSLSGPVTIINGEAFWGPYLSVLYDVVPNVMVGVETGFQYWSASAGAASASIWIIPVLLTGIYKFQLADAPNFTPFLGAGAGVGVTHGSIKLGSLSGSGTSGNFEGMLHAGAYIGAEQRFFADMKLGVIDGEFLIAPSIGYSF